LESYDLEKQIFTEFYYSGNDIFIGFVPDQGQPNTDVMLAFFNATGIVDSILYRNPIKVSYVQWFLYDEATFINHGTNVKFKHVFNDTIYIVKDYKLKPSFVLNLGAGKANENARGGTVNRDVKNYNPYEGMDNTYLYGESNRYIFLKVDGAPIFYDKKEQKVHKWELSLPDDKRIDPEHAKKFVPKYIDKNGNLIGEVSPANMEDNQVIVMAKLKR